MKKLIALLLGVLMLAAIPCAAFAEGNDQNVVPIETPVEEAVDETPEYYWETVAPYVEALGLEGQFYSLSDFGLDFWVPDALAFQELTEEDEDQGVQAYATDADENWEFMIVNLAFEQEIESLNQWQEILKEQQGIEDSVLCYVNDIIVLEYMMPEKDCFVCDMRVKDGSILEFVWRPFSDETFALNAGFMSNSIMAPEE